MEIIGIDHTSLPLFQNILFEPGYPIEGERIDLGLFEDDTAAGTAIFSISGEEAVLHSIFISPTFRRRGLGRELLNNIIMFSRAAGGRFITANYLKQSDDLEELLLSLGFIVINEPSVYTFTLEEAKKSDFTTEWIYGKEYSGTVRSLSEMDRKETNAVLKFLEEGEYPVNTLKNNVLLRDLSLSVFDKHGEVAATVLCSGAGDRIIIDFLHSRDNAYKQLLLLIRSFFDAVENNGYGLNPLVFQAINPMALSITEKLIGKTPEVYGTSAYAVFELF